MNSNCITIAIYVNLNGGFFQPQAFETANCSPAKIV
jgi:hypothetical protein